MAITPIDLQTVFSQVDKVGKTQVAQKEGQALAQAIQGAHIQKKTEEQINMVNEAQNTGEGADKINDHSQRRNNSEKKEREKQEEKEKEEKRLSVLRDPALGNKIDISL
ncbi:MAG: hypothetical protein FWD40_11445 [Treponema sp.]|nr:hypothetical protein [Treponema sp.]